jgi:hypothetical protein
MHHHNDPTNVRRSHQDEPIFSGRVPRIPAGRGNKTREVVIVWRRRAVIPQDRGKGDAIGAFLAGFLQDFG